MEKVKKIFCVSWVILIWIYSLISIFASGILIVVDKEIVKGLILLISALIINSLLIKWNLLIKENERT